MLRVPTGDIGVTAPLPGREDTIAALATPAGRSALAVLRMSGPGARTIAARILDPWRDVDRLAYRATLRDGRDGAPVDRPIVIVYHGPRSYTGEDVVELLLHGGRVGPVRALGVVLGAGAREALPGEFTRRAVAAGKIDLLQAEAVADLIDAESVAMHRAAIDQLDGHLSRHLTRLRDHVLDVEAMIAYDIDFPEEDDGPIARDRVLDAANAVQADLTALLASARTGEIVRRGAMAVLIGSPNVGKSSLFNALLQADRAIVTPVPGTTRDAIEAHLELDGWPVRLVDTAGLRASSDAVERIGIAVTAERARAADLVLACGDDDATLEAALVEARALARGGVVAVRTKADLVAECDQLTVVGAMRVAGGTAIAVSAKTGAGLSGLRAAIADALGERRAADHGVLPLLTRERHGLAVREAVRELTAFAEAWRTATLPAPVAAVHLRAAATALEALVGVIDVDDVLDRVFSTFCVGK